MSKLVLDLVERTAATFAFSFLSVFSFTDLSTAENALIAGAAAAATVVKSWLAQFVGDPDSAGLTK